MYSFPNLEPVYCSISSSNCCFLTCIYISQEAGQVVWYFHLFKNFPLFAVIHTIKGFGIVNKVEVDVFLELSCFFDDPTDVGNLISGSPAFSKSSLNIWKFMVHILLNLCLENLERLKARGKGDDRGWDGWMASPTQWTWVWVNSRSWWWTGSSGVLQSMGYQRVGHDWVTELNWTELNQYLNPYLWSWWVYSRR